jgi:hypothetical protein
MRMIQGGGPEGDWQSQARFSVLILHNRRITKSAGWAFSSQVASDFSSTQLNARLPGRIYVQPTLEQSPRFCAG